MQMKRNKETTPDSRRTVNKAVMLILITFGALLLLIAAATAVLMLLPEEKPPEPTEIYFYPVVEENIFEDAHYLSKDRSVHYCDDPRGQGITTQITDADRDQFDVKVRFTEIYLNCLMSGDCETLRQLCSEEFLRKNAIPDFTQQMLYDMYVYFYHSETLDGAELVTYKINYKILRNNGTYRRDVGSDGAKPEYLVLRVSTDGTIQIADILR